MRDYYNIMNDLPPFLSAQITKYIKMRLITAVPMFTQTSEDCREALATYLDEEMIAPGCNIVTRGDVATSMYFIMHGMVEVLVIGADGIEMCLTTLKEGSWFGEIALLQDTTRTASVRAATAVKVFKLEKLDFNALADQFPELRARIQEVANARINALAKKTEDNKTLSQTPSTDTLKHMRSPIMINSQNASFSTPHSTSPFWAKNINSPSRRRHSTHDTVRTTDSQIQYSSCSDELIAYSFSEVIPQSHIRDNQVDRDDRCAHNHTSNNLHSPQQMLYSPFNNINDPQPPPLMSSSPPRNSSNHLASINVVDDTPQQRSLHSPLSLDDTNLNKVRSGGGDEAWK
jgi:CRP-like cAMP-binding protein